MSARTLLLALGGGVSAFVLVGVVVTELASSAIEFSLFVGIPAGFVAGVAVASFVYVAFGEDEAASKRRLALAFGRFGVTFPVVLLVTAVVFRIRNSRALPIAAVAALLVSVVTVFGPRALKGDQAGGSDSR